MQGAFTNLHRMENVDTVIIDWILYSLDRVSDAYFAFKRAQDVIFAGVAPKCRLVELDKNTLRGGGWRFFYCRGRVGSG